MSSRLFVPGARPGPFPVTVRPAPVATLAALRLRLGSGALRPTIDARPFSELSRAERVAAADREGRTVYRPR